MTSQVIRHEGAKVTTVAARIGRLSLAPDVHSDRRVRQDKRTAPLPWLVTRIDARPVPQTAGRGFGGWPPNLNDKASDMTKSTRGAPPLDSRTCDTGVKITPPTHAGPATTTPTTR